MEPIISPWAFYAISLCGKVSVAGQFMMFASMCMLFISLAFYLGDEEASEDVKKATKIAFVLFIVGGIIFLLVPNKETAITMLTTSIVTPDNITAIQDNVVDFIQKIAKAVAEAK